MNSQTIKCIVACINANGEPDLFFVKVKATQEQLDRGDVYDAAKKKCDEEGYDAVLAYDQYDSAGFAMLEIFEWDTASIVDISTVSA